MPWFVSCCFEVFPNTASSMPRCTEEGAEGDPWRLKPARFSGAHGKKMATSPKFPRKSSKDSNYRPQLELYQHGGWHLVMAPMSLLSNAFHDVPAAWSVRVARTHQGSGKGWGSGRLFPSWCWSWWTRTACLGHIFLGKSWEGIYDMNGGNGQIYLDTYIVLSLSLYQYLSLYNYRCL